ncbi:MAG TPA: zinc-dependent metalloprotease [Actinomycetales bacterium]|nr:zinc-dependent metalloprotease [Actinomycetales bacterium]
MVADNSWEDVLRSMLGEEGAQRAIEAMREAGMDPAALGEAAGLPEDPGMFQQMISQIQQMIASSGDGPVNWELAHDVARQQVHSAGDPPPSAAQDARVRQQLQAADLWLDSATELVGATDRRGGLSRAQWVKEALPTFQKLAEPVAQNVVRAVSDMMTQQLGDVQERLQEYGGELPEELAALGGMAGLGGIGEIAGPQAMDMLRRIGGATYGMQLGAAVASLAQEAFGLTDLGVPLTESVGVALVPANVDEFTDGLEIPAEEVAQFLAVREVAHGRLYAASPWLREHVIGLVTNYAREISIDVAAMEEAFREIDPTNPEQIREALGSGIFAPAVTESQKETLESLETTLAVIEGWVEHVTSEATRGLIPHSVALTEMMRRRRATGGPAEGTFHTLVGLELRPRRCRDATVLWETLTRELGVAERDTFWSHPDLLPTSAELDDPSSLLASRAEVTDLDDALEALLREADEASASGGREAGASSAEEPTEDASSGPSEDAADEPSGDSGEEPGSPSA